MSTVWLNGDLAAADAARIDPRDRGFLLGDGIFETFTASDGYVFRLTAHLARLRAGAALLGVTRRAVIELAAGLDLGVRETILPVERLAEADEAFLTNSPIGVCPLVALDGHPIGGGTGGPATLALAHAYAAAAWRP